MREALENERTAKSALFKREQAEAESERLREAYDVLVGQFEAIKSQVELEKLEAQGIVTRYERELEDVYGKLNAKDEYAGLLCGVRKDMDVEMSDLWGRLEAAEEAKQKVEQAFLALGGKHRAASARRIFNFMVVRRVSESKCRLLSLHRSRVDVLSRASPGPWTDPRCDPHALPFPHTNRARAAR